MGEREPEKGAGDQMRSMEKPGFKPDRGRTKRMKRGQEPKGGGKKEERKFPCSEKGGRFECQQLSRYSWDYRTDEELCFACAKSRSRE